MGRFRWLSRGVMLVLGMVIILGSASANNPPTGLAHTPWPMFQHDLQHSGRSDFDSAILTPTVMWKRELQSTLATGATGTSSGMSIAADGTVYMGVHGDLVAMSYPDGMPQWQLKGLYSNTVPAVASDNRLYWGFDDTFVVLSPTGTIMGGASGLTNSYTSGGSSVVAPDGTVYIIKKALWSWTPDGELNWYYVFDGIGADLSTPALGADGTIYVVSIESGGTLFAISPEGEKVWSSYFSANGSPTIAPDGTIYAGSNNGTLHAFNPDGSEEWVFEADTYGQPVGTATSSSPVLASDGTIYVSVTFGPHYYAKQSQLYALNPNGSLKWKYPATGALNTNLHGELVVDSQNRVIGCASDNRCYAFNPDGTLRWTYYVGAAIRTSPLIPEAGVIWILDSSGMLHALTDEATPFLHTSVDSLSQCGVSSQSHEIAVTTGDLVTTWSASVPSDAPWLVLDQPTGSTTETLKLSIDPLALSTDVSQTLLRITVDDPSVPNEVVSIPVTLNTSCSLQLPMLAR